jgi:hypothetical protein
MTLSDFEQYLDNMSKPGNWGDGIVFSASVNFFGRSTIIHTVEGEQLIDASEPFVNSEPMHLGLINGNHYLSAVAAPAVHKAGPRPCHLWSGPALGPARKFDSSPEGL